jgi:hypothetical protein
MFKLLGETLKCLIYTWKCSNFALENVQMWWEKVVWQL